MDKKRILKMLEMQYGMNCVVSSEWTTKGWSWKRAMLVEAVEMIEHYGWKWWKKQTPDIAQAKMELVDIWHFLLSEIIEGALSDYSLECMADSLSLESFEVSSGYREDANFLDTVDDFIEQLMTESHYVLRAFIQMTITLGMSFDELYTMYVGKNTLNRFRQDNGYKEGTYHKIWDGEEDNLHLVHILNNVDKTVLDIESIIYAELETEYTRLTK